MICCAPADKRNHEVAVRLVEHIPEAILGLLELLEEAVVTTLFSLHEDGGVCRP